MTLGQHLVELRRRLVRSAAAILLCSVGGYLVANRVIAAMQEPIEQLAKQQHRLASLNYQGLTDAFDLKIQVAFTIGIVVASPIWLYQLWAFLVPGMTRREIRYGLGFFSCSVVLFVAGCAAGWFVVPHIVQLLASFAPEGTDTLLHASDYVDFIVKLMLAVGIAFVLPVFLVLLNFVGVLSGHSILRAWRVAMLLIVAFTAIATPSADIASMFLLAIPMVGLYFGAAGVCALHDRRVLRAVASAVEPAVGR
jgi:sec-independent protein translocase protein TatC